MHCQTDSRRRRRWPGRGIATVAATTGLLVMAAGCGFPASHVTVSIRPAAAHEAIPVAAEGSLGTLNSFVRGSRPNHSVGVRPGPASFGAALFGGNAGVLQLEPSLHRRLAIVRVYYHIGEAFPYVSEKQHMAEGRTLLVSLDSDGPSYASIAAGNKDASIMAFLRSANRAAFQYHLGAIYVSFEHEPDGPQHANLGSAAQFVRAWNHVHQLAVSAHLNWNQGGRLRWVLILIHNAYESAQANGYWPGSSTVDLVGADGYNSFRCRSSYQNEIQTPSRLFNATLAFARAHGGVPVFIPEWGSNSALASSQTQFIQEMQSYVATNPQIKAALYWDDGGPNCSYRVNSHPASVAALAAMGHSPVMQGKAG